MLHAKDFLQAVLHGKKVKQAHWPIELNQEVYITGCARFIPPRRPKQGKKDHAHPLKFCGVCSQPALHLMPVHVFFPLAKTIIYRKTPVDSTRL